MTSDAATFTGSGVVALLFVGVFASGGSTVRFSHATKARTAKATEIVFFIARLLPDLAPALYRRNHAAAGRAQKRVSPRQSRPGHDRERGARRRRQPHG